jgi:hypothetical protein
MTGLGEQRSAREHFAFIYGYYLRLLRFGVAIWPVAPYPPNRPRRRFIAPQGLALAASSKEAWASAIDFCDRPQFQRLQKLSSIILRKIRLAASKDRRAFITADEGWSQSTSS